MSNLEVINVYNTPIQNKDFYKGIYSGLTVIMIAGLVDKMFIINMIYASLNDFCPAFIIVLTISEFINVANLIVGNLLKKIIGNNVFIWVAIFAFVLLGICLIVKGCTVKSKLIADNDIEDKEKLVQLKNNKINGDGIGIFNSWWQYFLIYLVGSFLDKSQLATIFITSKYNFAGLWIGSSIAQLILVFLSMILGKSISHLLTNKQIYFLSGIMFLIIGAVFTVDKILFKYFRIVK